MQYLKSKIKVQVLKAYMPFLFILVVIGSCENRTEPKKEIPTRYPKQLSVNEIFELQDVESQEAIRRLENSGYKYELDLNKEGTVCSVYAFDLREDKTASQRICVGHRDGKKYLAIHTFDRTRTRNIPCRSIRIGKTNDFSYFCTKI